MSEKRDKVIASLEEQLKKLDAPDFELESWKKGVLTRLLAIYPKTDERIDQLKEIKIDYSSWALRDSNGDYKPVHISKKKCRALLEGIIEELQIFGLRHHTPEEITEPAENPEHAREFQELSKNPDSQEFQEHLKGYSHQSLREKITEMLSAR